MFTLRRLISAKHALLGELCALGAFGIATMLGGCAVVEVAGAAAGAAISVTGTVVATGVSVAGKVVEKTIDVVTPSSGSK